MQEISELESKVNHFLNMDGCGSNEEIRDILIKLQVSMNNVYQKEKIKTENLCMKELELKKVVQEQSISSFIIPKKLKEGKFFTCTFQTCNKSFPTAWKLKRHKKFHLKEVPHQCTHCPQKFSKFCHLMDHYNLVHSLSIRLK